MASSTAVRFFGKRWPAPAFAEAVEAPAPIGAACLMCEEPVAAEDSGILQTAVDVDLGVRSVPVHIECHLRSIMGGVAHLEHRCSCYGGSAEHDGHGREAARATMRWIVDHHPRSDDA